MKSDTFSRRAFLKSGAIAAGALVASPVFADDDAPLPGVRVSSTYPETSAQLKIADPARFTVLQFT
ncbi:MAG: twin-arginine translocation signal domain-containing protein, partial [Candidatus Hydrogenedentes bacterium]|nr:twin-arginine translocation signal domain-containing protein [Candidatus Hydrogenedentota bacterium]